MDGQKQKARDWTFLFPNGKPTVKHRLELNDIKNILIDLELDVEGFDFDTESSFCNFVMAKNTPGDSIVEFLKKIFTDANIDFTDTGFRRLDKKGYLELFFEVFTFGIDDGDGNTALNEETTEKSNAGKSNDNCAVDLSLTMASMDNLYKNLKKETITSISYAKFFVTDQIPVRAQDNFALRLRDNAPKITHGKAALFNIHLGKTVAVGHLEGTDDKPNLVFESQNIDYESIQKNRKHEIILFPSDDTSNLFYAVNCELGFRKLDDAKRTLCIDFGTSNTTAGSYGILDEQANQPEFVEFPDVTCGGTKRIIPTLVYIDSCEEGQPIRYFFGYDAVKRVQDDHFENKATVFHEIKSWINDLDREEVIFDSQGNNREVRREEIVKAYISHVISLSEQYFHKRFKSLHFSSPVKLKESFLGKMRQMFSKEDGYLVLDNDSSLDEGIAIVYNHIAKRIEDMEDGELETVFVIDCGGGTTDLARCEYSRTSAAIGENKKILSVKTSFENGDSAFGGNNITYRILQLLKIKIDAFLQNKPNPDMLEIISDDEIDIMTKLDEGAENKDIFKEKNLLYKNFLDAYEAAEEHIPTRYHDAEFDEDIGYMRRNYNYLWQMAEAIKIEFYKSSSTVSIDFAKEEDRNICTGGQDDYYLYTRKNLNAQLEKQAAPLGNIRITIKEISRTIYPDIYALLSILLGEYEEDGTLQKVNYYKLSGQSCNITLFHDLMKEFIPGRNIRRHKGTDSAEDRTKELKIACLEGSIRYLMAKEFSRIQPKIEMSAPKMIYTVWEDAGDGKENLALDNENVTLLRNFISGRRIHFIVKDAYDQQKNSVFYNFELDKNKREDISLADLKIRLVRDTYWRGTDVEKRIIAPLNNITLHSKEEKEQCIFLLPAKNGYGFRIYQVRISYGNNGETKYSLIKNQSSDKKDGEYHSFEQMTSFFDGKR